MAKRGTAYKPSEADRVFVERAVMAGSRINDIANCLNVTDDTLRKHFRYEIMTARERLKGDAVRVVMDSLEDGSLDAAKYVLARVAGWTERQDHTSSDGSMSPREIVIKAPGSD
jgi:predicted transcriptional regulator